MLVNSLSSSLPTWLVGSMADPSEEFVMKSIALTGGFFIATVWIVMKTIRVVSVKRAAETTKREIAAYVAEGSIRPEDAATIINAGSDNEVEKITSAVAAGIISPAKAEKLIASLRNTHAKPAG